jgi:hypothetical protein
VSYNDLDLRNPSGSGVWTVAQLNTYTAAQSSPIVPGTRAYTTSGLYTYNGSVWASVSASGLPTGITAAANSINGQNFSLAPQSQAGVYAQSGASSFHNVSSNFTGNLYVDQVTGLGYNRDPTVAGNVANFSIDTFSSAYNQEANYESANSNGFSANQTGTASSVTNVTNATVTDSGKTWPVNAWVGWTVYFSGLAGTPSARITANTGTVLTLAGTVPGLTGTPAYSILWPSMEMYYEWSQVTSAGAGARYFRPFFWTFDRATAVAQIANGNNATAQTAGNYAAITISGATLASPAVISCTVNHGLTTGMYVNFSNLTGNGWSNATGWTQGAGQSTGINGYAYPVTVTSATSFSIPINSTSFTGTTPGGYFTPTPILASSQMLASTTNGFRVNNPDWNTGASANGTLMLVQPGALSLYAGGSNATTLSLQTEAGHPSACPSYITFTRNGYNVAQLTANSNSSMTWNINNTTGGGLIQAGYVLWQSPGQPQWTFGQDGNFTNLNTVATFSAISNPAANQIVALKDAASQTGARLASYQSDGATLNWSIGGAATTGAVTPVLTGNKPTGAGTAIIGWIPVTIGAGAGYIPVWQ